MHIAPVLWLYSFGTQLSVLCLYDFGVQRSGLCSFNLHVQCNYSSQGAGMLKINNLRDNDATCSQTSVLWRTHGQGTRGSVPSMWYHNMVNSLTPRGYPAPGGGPNQYPSAVPSSITHSVTPRPQRPFTHASAQCADDLLLEAKELLWTQQPGKAAVRLEKALTMEPNHADAMALLGKIKMVGTPQHKTLSNRMHMHQRKQNYA
jgi:hypothetical protein